MAFEVWSFLALAFLLGLKHAFDADHVVAVSGLLTRRGRVASSMGLAGSWALGHMVTASLISALVYFFADGMLPRLVARLDVLVPFLLLAIGAIGLAVEFRRLHYHRHAHGAGGPEHGHLHVHLRASHEHGAMGGIGILHGLASNDELLVVLLLGLGATAWWQVFIGVGLFSLGVLAGMMAYALAAQMGSRWTGRVGLGSAMSVVFSVLSIAYAVYLLMDGSALNLLDPWKPGT